MAELYHHSPTCLHGVVLNELSAGTTLPFTSLLDTEIDKLDTICDKNAENSVAE
jgi:hypothetical protein